LVEETIQRFQGPNAPAGFAQLDGELDNVRSSLRWAIDRHDLRLGARLVVSLYTYWFARGALTEGRSWAEAVLALPGLDEEPNEHARVLTAAGALTSLQGDIFTARRYHDASVAILRKGDDQRLLATALLQSSYPALGHVGADLERVGVTLAESVDLYRKVEDRAGLAWALVALALCSIQLGSLDAAEHQSGESKDLFVETGDPAGLATVLSRQGDIARERGDVATARARYAESLTCSRELGETVNAVNALIELALLPETPVGHAAQLLREALAMSSRLGARYYELRALEALADVVAHRGSEKLSVRLLGAAHTARQANGLRRPTAEELRFESLISRLQEGLDTDTFDTCWANGCALSFQSAVVLALEQTEERAGR
jgi:non-specific serine/threonine protein kinase